MAEKITISRTKVVGISNALNKMIGSYEPKLKYAIKKNKDFFASEIAAIAEAQETNVEKYKEFDEKRVTKLKECVAVDDKGKPVEDPTSPGSLLVASTKREEWETFFKDLKTEYADAIKEREAEIKKHNEFMKEEVEMSVHKIDGGLIPTEVSQLIYEAIFPLFMEANDE